MTKVIKRDCSEVNFDSKKIKNAIMKAMKYGSGRLDERLAEDIASNLSLKYQRNNEAISIYDIEKDVFSELVECGHEDTARAYEGYRSVQTYKREHVNTTDDAILSLVSGMNNELATENSNKDIRINSTQRDYIAGEVSKDLTRRYKLPTHIVQAHDEAILHFHDEDYFLQPMNNCGLVNIKDMFDKGTVINGRAIRKPNSFQVACTVMTQIIAQVASSQYGGTSVAIKHLGEYLKISEDKYRIILKDIISDKNELENAVQTLLTKELQGGIQTIQYQILTLMTTNGQTPFVTLFLELDKNDKFLPYTARVIHELLKQRLDGIPNENGIKSTPTFPKLIYVLDDINCLEGGEYDWVTNMAIKCTSVRMYPDYISAKEMRKIYEGNVFSSMGCRSFLSPWKDKYGNYKFEGRFNQGVVTLNLPQIGIIANGDMETFNKLLDNRLALCFEALMCRHKALEGVKSDVAPILWQHGAYGRLKKGEPIDKLLHDGYSTISLGYIGLYEVTKLMTGESHTSPKGTEFALALMNRLNDATKKWKTETGLGFGLYGSPAESLCYRFAKIDKQKYGSIKDVTDKEYYTNSYHVDVREEIDAFSKLKFESQFQPISTGGCISYIEANNFGNNLAALKQLVNFIYHNIQYAEFNLKCDYCFKCGYSGQMTITDDLDWVCPNCGNTDKSHMEVVRRTCGYLGSNWWNRGKTNEISKRVLHI